MTSDQNIATARQAAERIAAELPVAGCTVDDFNKYNEFSLICRLKGQSLGRTFSPAGGKDTDLRPLVARMKGILGNFGPNTVRSPRRLYDSVNGEKYYKGYADSFIMIDLVVR